MAHDPSESIRTQAAEALEHICSTRSTGISDVHAGVTVAALAKVGGPDLPAVVIAAQDKWRQLARLDPGAGAGRKADVAAVISALDHHVEWKRTH